MQHLWSKLVLGAFSIACLVTQGGYWSYASVVKRRVYSSSSPDQGALVGYVLMPQHAGMDERLSRSLREVMERSDFDVNKKVICSLDINCYLEDRRAKRVICSSTEEECREKSTFNSRFWRSLGTRGDVRNVELELVPLEIRSRTDDFECPSHQECHDTSEYSLSNREKRSPELKGDTKERHLTKKNIPVKLDDMKHGN